MAVSSPTLFPPTGDPLIDGLLSGASWQLAASRTLTWGTADNPFTARQWPNPSAIAEPFAAALAEWAKVADIQFVYGGHFSSPGSAPVDITVNPISGFDLEGVVGLAVFPSATDAEPLLALFGLSRLVYPDPEGDIYINIDEPALGWKAPGSETFFTLLHEMGHALGLKHPHDSGIDGIPRPTFAALGIAALDAERHTLMSYNDVNATLAYGHASTPMPLDILAIQALYGPNLTTGLGDTRYVLGDDQRLQTVWDAGGVDVLDASSLASAGPPLTIDLRGGQFTATGTSAGTAIAYGTVIEDAVGSARHDHIIGNAADNRLTGGLGNDTIEGGAGTDTAVYAGPRSAFGVGRQGDTWIVVHTAADDNLGTDTLSGIERIAFSDGVMVLAAGAGGLVDVFRFYNAGTGTHFYTASAAEKDAIVANPARDPFLARMNFEGPAYKAFGAQTGDDIPLYRFYNQATGAHFFTASEAEKAAVVDNPGHDPFLARMVLEGVAYYVLGAAVADASPVWRFYSTLTGVHFYTASAAEKDAIVANHAHDPYLAALRLEGVAFWVPDETWGA